MPNVVSAEIVPSLAQPGVSLRRHVAAGYNAGMKLQFRTSDLFIATTFIAVSVGGFYALMRQFPTVSVLDTLIGFAVIQSPFWLPLVFLGYAIGRRAMTVRLLIVFIVAEAIGLGLMLYWRQHHYW